MLRKVRITMATILFIGICLLFMNHHLDGLLGWIAKIQFIPAVLSLNLIVILLLVLVTLLFGRVYCSVICPLGILQDIFTTINSRLKKKNRYRFKYTMPLNWLRITMAVLFVVAIVLGAGGLAYIIEPYSTFGRIASIFKGTGIVAVSAVSLLVIGYLAWRYGRIWCNSICPVGTVLGFLSRFSLFAPRIDTDKCRNCGLCARHCKSMCIDPKAHKIDYSRCVVCLDCLDECREGAIKYELRRKKSSVVNANSVSRPANSVSVPTKSDSVSRRAALKGIAVGAGVAAMSKLSETAALAQDMKVDGGLAEVLPKANPKKQTPLKPAGAQSLKAFTQKCVACQLCIDNCPNKVLRPSMDLDTFMQPEMSFDKGFCRPECTVCSNLCPAGAIEKVSREEKTAIKIGLAHVDYDSCLAAVGKEHCGLCARRCPSGAIIMDGRPIVNETKCIGCGACEYLCPVRPISAIRVEGFNEHQVN